MTARCKWCDFQIPLCDCPDALRKRVVELEQALKDIMKHQETLTNMHELTMAWQIARKALGESGK